MKTSTLVSLWDMVANFSFASIDHLLVELRIMISVSNHNMEWAAKNGGTAVGDGPNSQEAVAQSVEAIQYAMKAVENRLGWLKCSHVDAAAKRLGRWATEDDKKWSELNTRARSLRDAIETELQDYLFYQYPKDKGEKWKRWTEEWKKVLVAFPDLHTDVYSATDCYALQYNTASVFHSMRIAEGGLRALAKERRVRLPRGRQVEWATWQEIIKALDNEIKAIGAKKAGAAKDAALAFYSGARADLNGFKDEYRNVVMHVRANYDEFQALRALTLVHGFMERLSAKLDHTHQRIKWGRF